MLRDFFTGLFGGRAAPIAKPLAIPPPAGHEVHRRFAEALRDLRLLEAEPWPASLAGQDEYVRRLLAAREEFAEANAALKAFDESNLEGCNVH